MDLFVIDLVAKKPRSLRKKIEDVFFVAIVAFLLLAIIMFVTCFIVSSFSFKIGLILGIASFISMGLAVLFVVLRIIFDFAEAG